MKFPRNARILRGQLDMAPFACVFFLLALFIVVGGLIPTAGVPLQLPVANDMPGANQPTLSVALDAAGRLYYENQGIDEPQLKARLQTAVQNAPEPLALIVMADERVPYGQVLHLALLAREAGIYSSSLATLPGATEKPSRRTKIQP